MRYLALTAALVGGLAIAGLTLADEFNKKTDITVNETVLVPGKTLLPGKYVIKLLNVTGNRHVVQIFNQDQTQLEATILAFPDYRVEPKPDTVLTFWETPAGTPPALHEWFYPGDNYGQEFAYPKETAETISKANNNSSVPSYTAAGALTPDQAESVQVDNEPASHAAASASSTAANASDSAPADNSNVSSSAAGDSNSANQGDQSATNANANAQPAAQSAQTAPQANAAVAQNEPPAGDNSARNDNAGAADAANQPDELPRTASPMGWVLLAGLASLSGALALRRLRA
jgi:hypothetical protein